MAMKRKGEKFQGHFVGLPALMLKSEAYISASWSARALLVDIALQYVGDNNGSLTATGARMSKRGWRSETTLHKAKAELLEKGLIVEMRKGRRPNLCSLFALPWLALDSSPDYEPGYAKAFRRHAYLDFRMPPKASRKATPKACIKADAVAPIENTSPTPVDDVGSPIAAPVVGVGGLNAAPELGAMRPESRARQHQKLETSIA